MTEEKTSRFEAWRELLRFLICGGMFAWMCEELFAAGIRKGWGTCDWIATLPVTSVFLGAVVWSAANAVLNARILLCRPRPSRLRDAEEFGRKLNGA